MDYNFAVVDDEEIIHNAIESVVGRRFENITLHHFYDTDEIKQALYDDPTRFDLLLLDVWFPDCDSGIESLDKIREYAPILPIVLLTAEKNPEEIQYAWPYKIEYMPKPIDENIFVNQIQSVLYRKEEETQLFNALYEEISKLTCDLNSLAKDVVPDDLQLMLTRIFPNLEFTGKAVAKLAKSGLDKNILNGLMSINQKSDMGNGARHKKFNGKEDVFYMRVSKVDRIFIDYANGQKPKIVDLSLNHEHAK